MLQNPCKTLGFKKNMVYKIPPGGGGKPYPASGLKDVCPIIPYCVTAFHRNILWQCFLPPITPNKIRATYKCFTVIVNCGPQANTIGTKVVIFSSDSTVHAHKTNSLP